MKYDLKKVFFENEGQYKSANEIFFRNFLVLFSLETGIDWLSVLGNLRETHKDLFFVLETVLQNTRRDLLNKYYDLMEYMGFDMLNHVRTILSDISCGRKVQEEIKLCKFISDVLVDDNLVTVKSAYGNFSAIPMRNYFKNKPQVLEYLNNNALTNDCHHCSYELMRLMDDVRVLTYLIREYFTGTQYHTVLKDENSMIVDGALELVFDEETFKKIQGDNLVSETLKKDFNKRYLEVMSESCADWLKYPEPRALSIALHEHAKKLTLKK